MCTIGAMSVKQTVGAALRRASGRSVATIDGRFGQRRLYMHNELFVSGVLRGQGSIEEVQVAVDGREYRASHPLPRPGLREGEGFELRLDTSGWSPGLRVVRVTVRDDSGAESVAEGEIELLPYLSATAPRDEGGGTTRMWCETPLLDGSARVVPPLRVEGWACCGEGVERVDVFVDGLDRVQALHGIDRGDLSEALGEERAQSAGFNLTLDPAQLAPGWHELTVVAIGADGVAVGVSGWLESLEREPEPAEPQTTATLVADRYVPEAHQGYSFEAEHHARYRWAATLAAGRRVLDAGCGTGYGAETLARAGAESVAAFDISLEAIENARARAGALVDFSVGELARLPYRERSFDLVTCFEAIEHVEDPHAALDELRRVLEPGGLLLISTPNRGVYAEGNPHHLHEFSSTEFEAAVGERFAHRRVFRQQTYAASLLSTDETFAAADPSERLTIDVRKLVGARAGEELYTVIVASESEIPPLDDLAMIGKAVDVAARIREANSWRDRALEAERAAAAARAEAKRSG